MREMGEKVRNRRKRDLLAYERLRDENVIKILGIHGRSRANAHITLIDI